MQALAREAKELARQRAQLEAQLAAERGTAQGHGYSPTPLVTPKAAKVILIMILEQMLYRVLRLLLLKSFTAWLWHSTRDLQHADIAKAPVQLSCSCEQIDPIQI